MTPPAEGSIYREGDHLVASLDFGYVNGRRKRPRRYVKLPDMAGLSTRRQKRLEEEYWKVAEAKLAALVAERDGGIPSNVGKQSVGQYLDLWLRDVVQVDLARSTYDTYSDLVRIHIKPAIAHLRLKALRPAHVRALLSAMAKRGLSASMRRQVRAVLHRALEQAIEDELIQRNAVRAVKRVKEPRSKHRTLDVEQFRTVLGHVATDRLGAMFVLATTTGIRKGELRGLRWDEVDLDRRMAVMRGQLSRVSVDVQPAGHPRAGQRIYEDQFAVLKGGAKPRAIALSDAAVLALRRHRDLQGFERKTAGKAWAKKWGLVFCRPDGTPLDKRGINTWFDRQLEAVGLIERDDKGRVTSKLTWHDLRRTMATLMADQNVSPAKVRDALGHSTISMTMDVYTERQVDAERVVAATMDALITGPTDEDSSGVAR